MTSTSPEKRVSVWVSVLANDFTVICRPSARSWCTTRRERRPGCRVSSSGSASRCTIIGEVPTTSEAVSPRMRSAAALNDRTTPPVSTVMMPTGLASTMVRSR